MWLLAGPSCADDWGLPTAKSYESVNGTYVFRTTPEFGQAPRRLGRCLGQLFKKVGDELRLEWERYLINNIAPHRAYVANSGKYVVTIGELGNFNDLPVVFYGRPGVVINVHGRLDQLVPPRMIARATLEHHNWIDGSLFFFGADDATFMIRVNVGYLICFETDNGELMDKRWRKKWHSFAEQMRLWNQVDADMRRSIITESLRLLTSEHSAERATGSFVLTQYTDLQSVATLRRIAEDKENVEEIIRQAAELTIKKRDLFNTAEPGETADRGGDAEDGGPGGGGDDPR
jgi:hypothetical protein